MTLEYKNVYIVIIVFTGAMYVYFEEKTNSFFHSRLHTAADRLRLI